MQKHVAMALESKLQAPDECEGLLAPSGDSFSHVWKKLPGVYTINY